MVICHISDIHFKRNSKNPVMEKITKLSAAIVSNIINDLNLVLIISGDIVYSGDKDEYAIAIDFLRNLENEIKKDRENIEIHYIIVPGNHDCDLKNGKNEIRDIILKEIKKDPQKASNQLIEGVLNVQNNFFRFYEEIMGNEKQEPKLYYSRELTIDNKKLLFQCFNTAWMSTIREKQGELIFLENELELVDSTKYDLVFSIFHHPLNWLESNNKRMFKEHIEKTSDLIITGHEHVSESYNIETDNTYTNKYYSGGVLQVDEGNIDSSFNIIYIDFIQKEESFTKYIWKEEMYYPERNNNKCSLKRNRYIERQEFLINEKFNDFLNDIGLNLTHSKQEDLKLEDIFIYPNIKDISKDNKSDNFILNGKSKDYIKNLKKSIIIGDEKSGKTSLSKMIYKDLFKDQIITISIDASKIKSNDIDRFSNLINNSFESQYDKSMLEKFIQLPKRKKGIIIDDFNKIGLKDKSLNKIIKYIDDMFSYVIIFSDQTFILNEITRSNENSENILKNYSKCEILECGHSFRADLISKWNNIGINHEENNIIECISMEKQINTAIGKNLLPKYPVYILLILQELEQNKSINSTLSTYGYLYEALILKDLSKIRKETDSIDMYLTFLSELAYYIFKNKPEVFDKEEIEIVIDIYNKKYNMKLYLEMVVNNLIDVKLLKSESNVYSFKYDFSYYYFVALYIKNEYENGENEVKSELETHIINMCKKLMIETNSNIILFLCHLSKNNIMISEIIKNAKGIFESGEIYKLEDTGKGICELYDKIPEILLPETKPEENRKKILTIQDELEYNQSSEKNRHSSEKQKLIEKKQETEENQNNELDEEDELDKVFEISKAFKTLQILGQIMKNYPGSLKADIKYEGITECYNLGARTIGIFMNIVDSNFEEIMQDLIDVYIEKNKGRDIDNKNLKENAKNTLFRICEMVVIGIIKRVSSSVSNEKLNETYKDILNNNKNTMFELIDIAIKMDSLRNFPEREVAILSNKLKQNYFAKSILRILVSQHFYFYECDYNIKQRICEKLEISHRNIRIQETKRQKLKN